jgi:hypothetical protein
LKPLVNAVNTIGAMPPASWERKGLCIDQCSESWCVAWTRALRWKWRIGLFRAHLQDRAKGFLVAADKDKVGSEITQKEINMRNMAIKWVTKCFREMGGTNFTQEIKRLKTDDLFLAEWCKVTGFKEVMGVPKNLNFQCVDDVLEVEVNGEVVEIAIGAYTIENDGYGDYECWGVRGFHKGQDWVSVSNVVCHTASTYIKWYIENSDFEINVETVPELF